jgi:hypothetical protein
MLGWVWWTGGVLALVMAVFLAAAWAVTRRRRQPEEIRLLGPHIKG